MKHPMDDGSRSTGPIHNRQNSTVTLRPRPTAIVPRILSGEVLYARALVLCPSCVVYAIPGHPTLEYKIGIYFSLEGLAALALHHQRALRSNVPLKRQIERSKPRYATADGQNRRDPDIWALCSRAAGGDALDEARRMFRRRRLSYWSAIPAREPPPRRAVAVVEGRRPRPRGAKLPTEMTGSFISSR
jgi:hypothetical protein